MGEGITNTVTEDKKGENEISTKKDEVVSLSDSDSSYVIEEEIIEYEITDSEEEGKSMNTKVSSKKKGDKSDQSSLFETALKMKEEEMKNKEIVVNIDNTNNELPNNDDVNTKPLKKEDNNSNDDENNVSNSFKNVFDSMENIKTKTGGSYSVSINIIFFIYIICIEYYINIHKRLKIWFNIYIDIIFNNKFYIYFFILFYLIFFKKKKKNDNKMFL